jgi:hypothetical protein
MNREALRLCLGAAVLAVAGSAAAVPTPGRPDADGDQRRPSPGAPYVEQVGSECVMVNEYLEQRDGVAERVVLRESGECDADRGGDLAVAWLSR